MEAYLLSILSESQIIKLFLIAMAAIPTSMVLVWKYIGYHYKERHQSNQHRIEVLKDENEKLKSKKPDAIGLTWESALTEIKAMEELLKSKTNRLLEEKDVELLDHAKKEAILRVNLEADLALIRGAIRVFMEEHDRALAYATILAQGTAKDDRVAKSFEVSEELLKLYTGVLSEAEQYRGNSTNKNGLGTRTSPQP